MTRTSAPRARLLVIGAALLFSTGGAAIKATTLSAWQVACFRSGVAAFAMLVLLPAARRGLSWRSLIVGVAYGATMVSFVVANKLTTAANTIFLQSTAPLYVLLASPWLLGERMRRRDIPYLLVLAAGLSLFFVGVRPPDKLAPDPLLGNIVAAGAGVAWALTLLGLRWLSRPDARGHTPDNLTGVLAGNVLVFLGLLPLALPVTGATTTDWSTIAYLGVVQIGLAYLLLSRGLAKVPALEASLLLLVEPVLNPIWAWIWHGEAPGPWAVTGGAVILGATAARTGWDFRAARHRSKAA